MVEIFGALFSFICLIIAAIRVASILRYDPACGLYECEFRNRLVSVAVEEIFNNWLNQNILGAVLYQHDPIRRTHPNLDATL